MLVFLMVDERTNKLREISKWGNCQGDQIPNSLIWLSSIWNALVTIIVHLPAVSAIPFVFCMFISFFTDEFVFSYSNINVCLRMISTVWWVVMKSVELASAWWMFSFPFYRHVFSFHPVGMIIATWLKKRYEWIRLNNKIISLLFTTPVNR